MTMQVVQRFTVTDFKAFKNQPENEDRLFELVDGEIIEVSPRLRHGRAASTIHGQIFRYLLQNPIGEVMFEVEHQLPDDPDNARLPDVSYISNERLTLINPDEPIPFMPDLAVEVKSPGNTLLDLRAKIAFYLANGTRLGLIMNPANRMIELYPKDEDVQMLMESDTLDLSSVLPDLKITLADLFRGA